MVEDKKMNYYVTHSTNRQENLFSTPTSLWNPRLPVDGGKNNVLRRIHTSGKQGLTNLSLKQNYKFEDHSEDQGEEEPLLSTKHFYHTNPAETVTYPTLYMTREEKEKEYLLEPQLVNVVASSIVSSSRVFFFSIFFNMLLQNYSFFLI